MEALQSGRKCSKEHKEAATGICGFDLIWSHKKSKELKEKVVSSEPHFHVLSFKFYVSKELLTSKRSWW